MEILFTDILTSNTKTTDCYVRCTLAIRKAFASKLASLLDCSLRFRHFDGTLRGTRVVCNFFCA